MKFTQLAEAYLHVVTKFLSSPGAHVKYGSNKFQPSEPLVDLDGFIYFQEMLARKENCLIFVINKTDIHLIYWSSGAEIDCYIDGYRFPK